MTELRQRMIEDLRLRNVADQTVVCYVRAVRQYAEFFGRSPDRLDAKHLRQYLLYLIEEKKVSQGTYNQKVAALRFFYRETLKKPAYVEGVCFTKKERKLPVVLSHDEIRRFLEALDTLKHRAILMTCYGAGESTCSKRLAQFHTRRSVVNSFLIVSGLMQRPRNRSFDRSSTYRCTVAGLIAASRVLGFK